MFKIQRMCYLFGTIRPRSIFDKASHINIRDRRFYHCDEPTQPFDNLPFRVRSRYTLTVVFSLLFGVGLWAPFIIVWYSMAKRTM